MANPPRPDESSDDPSRNGEAEKSTPPPRATELDLAIDHGSERDLVTDEDADTDDEAGDAGGSETAPPPGPADRT